MKWRLSGVLLFAAVSVLSAQDLPIPLVIFPYGGPDPQVRDTYGYALFAVPDLLREKLEATGKFRFLPLDPQGRSQGTGPEDEVIRLEAAREAGADYYVWGYLVGSSAGVKVVHRITETRQGTPVKVVSQDLPGGAELIDAMDRSVVDLAAGLNKELEALPPRVITVERVVEVSGPSPQTTPLVQTAIPPSGPPSDFSLGSGLTVFTGTYAGILAGALYLKAEITHPLNNEGSWDWGADLMIHGIRPAADAQLPEDQVPDLAYVPLLMKTSRRWNLGGFLDLGWELKAGGSLLIGTLGGNPTVLFRPAWSTGPLVEFWPAQTLGLRFQLDYLGTFLDWGKNYLQSLRLGLSFRFDV